MFARRALRAATRPATLNQRLCYATAATSSPAHFSATAVHNMNPHGLEISKAQRIAEDGLISGMSNTIHASYSIVCIAQH